MSILTAITSFLSNTSIFIAVVACLGLILQKKSFSDIIKGTLKTMIGVIVLTTGSNMLSGALTPLATAVSSLSTSENTGTLGDFGVFIGDYGYEIGMVMAFGFLLNVLIARFTPLKSICLTAVLLIYYPMLWVGLGKEAGMEGVALIAFGSVAYAISVSVFPHLLTKEVKALNGVGGFTVAHSSSLFCLLGAATGKLVAKFKKDVKNLEEMKFSPKLDFFRDTILVSGFVIILVNTIMAIIVTPEVRLQSFGADVVSGVLTQGMTFSAGMTILLSGARMMMTEIIPAFQGIAKKLVPGAVPGLDVPMIFSYGQNSLMLGFVVSLITSLVVMFAINGMGILTFALVPATVACYFDIAPGAIFANKYGGALAAGIWGVLGGILLMVVIIFAAPLLANTCGSFLQQFGGNECSIWTLILYPFAQIGTLFG